jgi:demethylmenaquinone methyltransferase/2-methoxy-6-polyprenyl-1,4-benzoquinol methylase/phosphoethanolamine N-methyltransferase
MNTENAVHHPAPKTRGQTIPWASFYDTVVWLLSFGKGRAMRNATIKLAQIKPGDSVLDVGCGTGDLAMVAKSLAGPTGEVVGADASPKMIDVARRKASRIGVDVTFQVDLIEKISFPDDYFDIVMSSLVMHHLPDDLKHEGLAEIYRVTKPGGRVLVVDMESSPGGSLGQRLSDLMIQVHGGHKAMGDNVKKLIPIVEAAGFKSVDTGVINRQLSFIAGKKAPEN